MSFVTEPKLVRLGSGPISYYEEYTTTNLYVQRSFGGNINEILITNDSTSDTAQISWDGATLEADIKAGETLPLKTTSRSSIYIKATTGGDKVRLWGW